MELVTTTVLTPGSGNPPVHAEQVVQHPELGLLVVTDAPSGRAGQALPAKRIAVEAVVNHIRKHKDVLDRFREEATPDLRSRILELVEEAFTRAAQELYAFARRYDDLRITLDVLVVLGQEAFIGHVGDGRVLLVRRGLVHQLTVDHTQAEGSDITEEAPAPKSGDKSARTRRHVRALGPEPTVRVESMTMEVVAGDRFIVTTPHVYQALSNNDVHNALIYEHLQNLPAAIPGLAPGRALALAAAQLGGGAPSGADAGRRRLALLAPMPLFTHCSERELREIASSTTPRRFRRGQYLFREGDPGTELFLLISGAVDIVRDGSRIVTLQPGSNFGEMAMLDEPTRSAGAVAAEDCELLVISREAFFAMLRSNPMLAVKILWNMLLSLSANLRRTSAMLAEISAPAVLSTPEEESVDLLGGGYLDLGDPDEDEIVGLETLDELDALEEGEWEEDESEEAEGEEG
ncbi:MAG: cyclic nucleotide-binding domain-containing protein [Deltaproteobacteria bacterium]|nr:MAG: cyclic nucleotide-binding domain-containing protein [Deltaproteobacteria bacterium]